jgi:hypothetical protein
MVEIDLGEHFFHIHWQDSAGRQCGGRKCPERRSPNFRHVLILLCGNGSRRGFTLTVPPASKHCHTPKLIAPHFVVHS